MSDRSFRLDNQIAVVTGACGRLGPVWAEALVDAGARVGALDLAGAPVSANYQALSERAGDRMRRIECDVTERRSIERALDEVISRLGEPSVLVNNAGIDQPPDAGSDRASIENLAIDQFRRMVEVNLLGAFQVTQVVGGRMAARGNGAIVNIGSLYGSVSPDQRFYDHMPGNLPFLKSPAYGASKAALVNMTRYFATLWGSRGVRVNALSPGGVLGGQDEQFRAKYVARVPLGRMAQPADLKGPLLFLASSASAYVTGHELRVDGGFTAW
ncbi:MAG: dehydrogenase [Acidobacteria bacterium RIFCSPLOWO2_02_FULL_68_18]|nr:MAG: dehydrogenase [Acidobacteria bacterium RIFCSPLOWO2_02_FULL_68_18]OFW51061.1 MAG: dehydrogenase [Acidobacteria bacterium RIFCSPLOWO2_12_FULL_68_19]